MKDFSNKEIINIVKAFIKEQNKIYKRFKVLKSRENFTACKIPKDVIKELRESIIADLRKGESINLSISDYFVNRHYGLNVIALTDHKSIEWRIFNGTVQPRKIIQYVKFCIEFCLKHAKDKK